MSEQHVRHLRFCFWSVGAVLLALWNPWFACGLAWLPLALFTPVFAATTDPCASCQSGTQSETVQFDVSGVDIGFLCSPGQCDVVNGTWILELTGGVDDCAYDYLETPVTVCGSINQDLFFTFNWSGGAFISIDDGGGSAPISSGSIGLSDPTDCSDTLTDIPVNDPVDSGRCDYTNCLVTVTP